MMWSRIGVYRQDLIATFGVLRLLPCHSTHVFYSVQKVLFFKKENDLQKVEINKVLKLVVNKVFEVTVSLL